MTSTLTALKRSLEHLSADELSGLCLRMAKLKAENKEFLAYLLNDADDPVFYATSLKPSISEMLENGAPTRYLFVRLLRKSNRIISRYARFTGNKQGELELILHQIQCFHNVYRFEWKSAATARFVFKALRKSDNLIMKLHEELRADYQPQLAELLDLSFKRLGREYFDELPMQSLK
ncbi:MAG: hypothetical protein IT240_08575 [Bacteroidia bacterium]|nr:hypothetical protein [Bacteroidia bacterium]